ncbi:MAG: hypothetical protein FWG38_06055, partial [Defluviitaleaceae bacterium]|nr:hypothetical protein [Defluviitaleaceae bacterium]
MMKKSCDRGRDANLQKCLGRPIEVVIDRPLGSVHPRYPGMVYPVNYGYVPGVFAGDGAAQDVYVLGVDMPLSAFTGVVIAVVRRGNDVEDKWVAAPVGAVFSAEEIAAAVGFQE